MSHARSRMLTDAQVAMLELHRKALELSLPSFRLRFDEALQRDGIHLAENSVRMRLDRVLNPRLRCPTTEQTLMALARALGMSILELEAKLEEADGRAGGLKSSRHRSRALGTEMR